MKTLSSLILAACLLSSTALIAAYSTYTVTNGLGQADQVNTGLTVDNRTGFVKNQDKDGFIYLVGYSGGAGDPRTQSVWRISAAVDPLVSADAWEFVLGGICVNNGGGEPGQVWVKLSNTFYSAFWGGNTGSSGRDWRFHAFYATNSLGQPTVGATALNPKTPTYWRGSETWTGCGQNDGAIIQRTSNDDLVYAGIKRSTDGLDLQIKRVATSSHTVSKLWERTTSTNNNDYSTAIYDGGQLGRVFGVYCRNASNPGNSIWCATNVNQLASGYVWATSTITNELSVDQRGGIVKSYDAPDGYLYVYGLQSATPAIWRRTANGNDGNWEPVIRASSGGGEGYQTWVKSGNIFFSSFWGSPNNNWAHKWVGLTNYAGQFGVGGDYTNAYWGNASSWSVCGQNIGAVLSNTVIGITNIIFIGTARADAGNAPDVQAVRISGTSATRTMLGGAGPIPGVSNRNDRSEAVLDSGYNGRAFFIFANYTNVYCATNIYANPANVTNLFVAVVLPGKTTERASIATTTVKGKKVLVVSACISAVRKVRVYNVDTLNGSPIYTYADITPSSVGNNSADRWSVGFAQMDATSTKLYATWDNASTTPQGNVDEIDLNNYDLWAPIPSQFSLIALPGNAPGGRPVDLEVVDLSQGTAVTGGTLVVVSICSNDYQRYVYMFNADKPELGLQDITPTGGLNDYRGRLASSGSKLFIDSSMYGADVKTEFPLKLQELGFAVPEPASAVLALCSLLLLRRRR